MQDISPSKGRTASNLVNQKMEKHDEFIKLDQESFMRENETRGISNILSKVQ